MKPDNLESQQSNDPLSTMTHKSVMSFLHKISGQEKHVTVIEVDHSYAKPWNRPPDPNIKARPAKFLFMKDFPKHFKEKQYSNDEVDVISVETKPTLPFQINMLSSSDVQLKKAINENDAIINEPPPPPKTGWNTQMNKLWTKAIKILHSDRLARLAYEGLPNEAILKKNLVDRSANKFRHLFSTVAFWDFNLLIWLHKTFNEHVGYHFNCAYHDCMNALRIKIPNLIDKFYLPPKSESSSRIKQQTLDPIQSMLNNYKPKRINGSPLFLIVPNGPQIPHQMTSQRMKHWHNLFGSLGKVITINIMTKQHETTLQCLNEIRFAVRDKIKECKATFNEGRPLVLVGFGHSALIAAHCALDNSPNVNATICLGFPLTAINGFRGDLDDPLLETSIPTLFVIGQNSTMATLDDIEDFRERIIKTETGLVVVGGANNNLLVSSSKKKFQGITQMIVDRCIADEIYEFVSNVLSPSSHDNHASGTSSVNRSGYSTPVLNRNFFGGSAKQKRKRITNKDKPKDSQKPKRAKIPKSPIAVTHKAAPLTPQGSITDHSVSKSTTTIKQENASEQKLQEKVQHIIASIEKTQGEIASKVHKKETTEHKVTLTTPTLTPLQETHSTLLQSTSSTASTPIQSAAPIASSTPSETHKDSTPKSIDRHQFSYDVSEFPTISQSATRAGRQIRAPKSLDV